MKNYLLKLFGFIGIVIALSFSNVIGKYLSSKYLVETSSKSSNEGDIDDILIQTSSMLNKKLPMMVNKDTRLDSTSGIGKEFHYLYTLISFSLSEIDRKEFKRKMSPLIKNKTCSTASTKSFLKIGVTLKFIYYGKNGNKIMSIKVTPSQCGY